MSPPGDDVRLPSIDGLRAFECAARLGTFERAADELAVTASAVAKRVATVEDLLGTPLLQRTGKALQLTAAGKEYLGHVRQALALLASVPLHRRAVQRVRRLRVTSPPTFARQVLVPQLAAFTAAHPEVELEIVLSVPYLDAPASDADIDIRLGDAAAHGGRVLMHDVVLPMAAPSLLARLPPMRTPADLASAPLLRTPIEPWTTWFRAVGLDWPEPASGMRLVDLGLTLEAAVSGQGVALVRPTLAHHGLKAGALRPLFAQAAVPAQQYHLLPHAGIGVAPHFAEWLHALCAQLAVDAQALAQTLATR